MFSDWLCPIFHCFTKSTDTTTSIWISFSVLFSCSARYEGHRSTFILLNMYYFLFFFECLINISYFEIFMYMYVWILLLHECYSFVRLRLVFTKYSPKWLRRSALYLNAYNKETRKRDECVTNKQKINHIKQYSVITKFKKLFRNKII